MRKRTVSIGLMRMNRTNKRTMGLIRWLWIVGWGNSCSSEYFYMGLDFFISKHFLLAIFVLTLENIILTVDNVVITVKSVIFTIKKYTLRINDKVTEQLESLRPRAPFLPPLVSTYSPNPLTSSPPPASHSLFPRHHWLHSSNSTIWAFILSVPFWFICHVCARTIWLWPLVFAGWSHRVGIWARRIRCLCCRCSLGPCGRFKASVCPSCLISATCSTSIYCAFFHYPLQHRRFCVYCSPRNGLSSSTTQCSALTHGKFSAEVTS